MRIFQPISGSGSVFNCNFSVSSVNPQTLFSFQCLTLRPSFQEQPAFLKRFSLRQQSFPPQFFLPQFSSPGSSLLKTLSQLLLSSRLPESPSPQLYFRLLLSSRLPLYFRRLPSSRPLLSSQPPLYFRLLLSLLRLLQIRFLLLFPACRFQSFLSFLPFRLLLLFRHLRTSQLFRPSQPFLSFLLFLFFRHFQIPLLLRLSRPSQPFPLSRPSQPFSSSSSWAAGFTCSTFSSPLALTASTAASARVTSGLMNG